MSDLQITAESTNGTIYNVNIQRGACRLLPYTSVGIYNLLSTIPLWFLIIYINYLI